MKQMVHKAQIHIKGLAQTVEGWVKNVKTTDFGEVVFESANIRPIIHSVACADAVVITESRVAEYDEAGSFVRWADEEQQTRTLRAAYVDPARYYLDNTTEDEDGRVMFEVSVADLAIQSVPGAPPEMAAAVLLGGCYTYLDSKEARKAAQALLFLADEADARCGGGH